MATNPPAPVESNAAPVTGQAPELEQQVTEYKKFFEDISPLLSKLDENPDLVKAIVEGNMTPEFAKAALEGKLTVGDAQAASAATEAIKNNMAPKAFDALTPDSLAKLVEEKMDAFKQEFTAKDEMRTFTDYTNKFISETPDFEKYTKEVSSWLDEHSDITDVRVAYYAVKGELSEKDAKAAAAEDAAENAKNVLLNASGGGIQATHIQNNTPLVDSLISSRSNPNSF